MVFFVFFSLPNSISCVDSLNDGAYIYTHTQHLCRGLSPALYKSTDWTAVSLKQVPREQSIGIIPSISPFPTYDGENAQVVKGFIISTRSIQQKKKKIQLGATYASN